MASASQALHVARRRAVHLPGKGQVHLALRGEGAHPRNLAIFAQEIELVGAGIMTSIPFSNDPGGDLRPGRIGILDRTGWDVQVRLKQLDSNLRVA